MTNNGGWILEAQQRALSPAMQRLAQNAIIASGEQQMRFLVWDDKRFVGFRPTRDSAQELAHEQTIGTVIYICDPDAYPGDHYAAFCVVAGTRGAVGPLPFELRQQGFWFAKHVLADNIVTKRDVMLETQAALLRKHGGNQPPLDSPPHPDRELWVRVGHDFQNAKTWAARFAEKHP